MSKININIIESKIFELLFNYYLKRNIKKDYIPNNYKYFSTPVEIQNWATKYFEYFKTLEKIEFEERMQQAISLNPPERIFLIEDLYKWYAGNFFRNINALLRGAYPYNNVDYVNKKAQILEQEINKFQLEDNVIVIRRISNKFLESYLLKDKKLTKGVVFSDKAFLSTSMYLYYRNYTEGSYKPLKYESLLIIKVPKKTNAIYLEPISNREEYELLLPKNLTIVVEKKIKIFSNYIIFSILKI
ncbi:MAG: hypothetical protein A2033_15945 [Bacteroidetes bacterium GWA2_31_9]|nr:MAG: hypothetical protein A2033_15945 [Bacteroidetes bacterium GWA2_31_9]